MLSKKSYDFCEGSPHTDDFIAPSIYARVLYSCMFVGDHFSEERVKFEPRIGISRHVHTLTPHYVQS